METKLISPSSSITVQAAIPAEVKLFTIKNNRGTKLELSNCGAAVLSLYVTDKHGNFDDVVLGYDDPYEYLQDEYYIGTVVGRYANRINGDTVIIDDQAYKLAAKPGGYHQHGGNIGFNKKIFSAKEFKKPGQTGIIFQYTSPHMEEGFPGELQLEVIYTLDDDDEWIIEYKAVCNQTTLINLTQHTYFNLSGKPSNSIDDHELKISGNYYLPVNAMQVPTGKLEKVNNTAFDFPSFKKIA